MPRRIGIWTVLLAALPALCPQAAWADEPAPSALSNKALVSGTKDALEKLKALDAGTRADREAFEQGGADIERATAAVQKPMPQRPVPLEEQKAFDIERIRAELKRAQTYTQAFEAQRQARARGRDMIRLLEGLQKTLRPATKRLVENATALRPLLLEAQRRVEGGDIKVGTFDEGVIATWVDRTRAIINESEARLAAIDKLDEGFTKVREAFDKLPPEDAATGRLVHRAKVALEFLAEVTAAADEQRAQLKTMRADNLPTEVARTRTLWDERREALVSVDGGIDTQGAAYARLRSEIDALKPPRRNDIEATDDPPLIREAKRDVALAEALLEHYAQMEALLERSQSERAALLKEAGAASKSYADLCGDLVNAWVTLEHTKNVVEEGKLTDWKPDAGYSHQLLWDDFRRMLGDELDRMELLDVLNSVTDETKQIERVRERVAQERERLRQSKARLETELAYAEVVAEMRGVSTDALLALFTGEGAIETERAANDEKIEEARAARVLASEACLDALRTIRTIENPATRDALTTRDNAKEADRILEAIQQLPEGEVLPDRSTTLKAQLIEGARFPPEFESTGEANILELATKEGKFLARQEQVARVYLDYFETVDRARAALDQALQARREADQQVDAGYQERVRIQKRRYAAAREMRRRIRAGTIERAAAPASYAKWLDRRRIQSAEGELLAVRRENSAFDQQGSHEIKRLAVLAGGLEWVRIRSRAASDRARLIGQPLALLASALTPLDALDAVQRKNLEFESKAAISDQKTFYLRFIRGLTSEEERARFEEPLQTFYLQRANTARVIRDLEGADAAYSEITKVAAAEAEALEPAREVMKRIVAQRLTDYHDARYAAAVARHPTRRARIEESYRDRFKRGLVYPLDFDASDVSRAAQRVFAAEARIVGARTIGRSLGVLLSKTGIQQEIGWYRTQMARVTSLLEGEQARAKDVNGRITTLEASYVNVLQSNGVRGILITLLIPVLAFVAVRLVRRSTRRFETTVEGADDTPSDRQRRLQTISRTTTAAVSVLIWLIALFYIFARLGLDLTPIIASASVVGLAVAFGAQALIRDFFSGFFILLENQFTIGDVVKLGTITGTVEKISLRVTTLRDLKGVVHYVPNGSIGQVSNLTQGWSRVVTEISVSYKEDPDRVMEVMGDELLKLAQDEKWKKHIIEDPVVAGVENLTERSVDVRIMIKVKAGQQWAVAREARRRIKKRFDKEGIEIPFPSRVVHHVYEGEREPTPDEQAGGGA